MANEQTMAFTVNGQARTVTTDPGRPLLEVLREELRLTGAKLGCGEGRCGTCTVLLGGNAVRSCITPVADAEGKAILTIEGLAAGDKLHPVQGAFLAEAAFQCGFCTPGMVLEVVALLNEKPNPTDAEIRARMEGHLCRCCGYPRILNAVRRAAQGGGKQP
ncbi:MAG: (2Fe-2S)-binding protein [Planctomycetes bacterium]|nr:(2Fe-2S)-binding protein [Planctomycetota bacterium]